MNLYGDFYLPEIKKGLDRAPEHTMNGTFKSGWLGNKFAKMMLPGTKKMKTFADKNPVGSNLTLKTIDRFIDQQKKTLELLSGARTVNLSKVKTNISISKWLKLRLGDTFRVLIYHNERHILQAQNAVE